MKYREFIRHAGKYLKDGAVIELEDRVYDVICQTNSKRLSDNIKKLSDKPNLSDKVISTVEDLNRFVATYGCGCAKKEGKNICPKHSRV